MDGMLHLPLTRISSSCATWFALTRHEGLDVVGSFDNFLIVFHALGLLCVILVDVMTFSYIHFFYSVIMSIRLLLDCMVLHQKGCLNICSCIVGCIPGTCSVRHPLGMRL